MYVFLRQTEVINVPWRSLTLCLDKLLIVLLMGELETEGGGWCIGSF